MDLAVASETWRQFLWSEKNQLSLETLKNMQKSGDYPVTRDLGLSVLCALLLTILKMVLDRIVFTPLAKRILFLRPEELPFSNSTLELEFVKSKGAICADINMIKTLATTQNLSVEKINLWLKVRQARDRNANKLQRFLESLWRLVVYSTTVCVGVSVLMPLPWVVNREKCWDDWETHKLDPGMGMFYIYLQLPLYLHLLFTLVTEMKNLRSVWEMTLHHVLVILLMTFSYLGNFVRIGALALMSHDVTHVFLEMSKMSNYLKWYSLSDLLFASFALSWVYARLWWFSTEVVLPAFQHKDLVLGNSQFVFLPLLCFVLVLDLYWFKIIASMAYRILWGGVNKRSNDVTDMTTDDDSDSSYWSDSSNPLKRHED